MPYVPSIEEGAHLRDAVDAARFSEGERIGFITALLALLLLDLILAITGASLSGSLGAVAGFVILYWRLRAPWLRRTSDDPHRLFSLGLLSRPQRAFTALMLRQALTGRNALALNRQHNPYSRWS